MTAKKLLAAGLTLHYEDDGDPDKPPILLLHGIISSAATWSWLLPHLAANHRVARLDFRGHGRSDRAPGTYAYPGYVADATAICEDILARPAVIVGHSLGGATAAGLAQTRPDLVRGLVLEDPAINQPPTSSDRTSLDGNQALEALRVMRESIPRLQASGMSVAELAKTLRDAPSPSGPTFGEASHEDAIEAMAEAMLQVDVTVLDAVFDGSHAPVFDPQRELPVPGIILAGDPTSPDTVVRQPELAPLTEHSPHIEQRIVAGAGHLIHDSKQHRSAVLDAVRDLLDRL